MKLNTGKKTIEFLWSEADTKWEETIAGKYAQPALDFVLRTAEIILVAGAFQVAANATHNFTLQIFSTVMFCALGVHFGLAWGRFILFPLIGVKVKASCLNLIIILVFGFGLAWLQQYLWQQIYAAAKALVVPT